MTVALTATLNTTAGSGEISGQFYITGFGWWDNSPPGNAIALPGLHSVASGTGTYADPITMAVGYTASGPDYPAGTKFYFPNLRKYLIVEDECDSCHAGNAGNPWIDIWCDGSSVSTAVLDACENSFTGTWLLIRNPASNYAVVSGIISTTAGCAAQYGNTVVISGSGLLAGNLTPSLSLSATLTTGTVATRSQYVWPFTWDSIWNMPISVNAVYGAGLQVAVTSFYASAGAGEFDSVNPAFPVKTLQNSTDGAVPVYCDPNMHTYAQGQWNTSSAFLKTDGSTVYQGQTTTFDANGNPLYGGVGGVNLWPNVDIKTSQGIQGSHGGSSLSALGGTLTAADLTGSGPITHACKIIISAENLYSGGPGYRWPSPGTGESGFGGSNPQLAYGALLALPGTINPATAYSDPLVRRIATAFQNYGVYVVDQTGDSGDFNPCNNYNASFTGGSSFNSDMLNLVNSLKVINNNASSTPGGGAIGSNRRAPYAPKFTDGTNVPPAVTVVPFW